jgi:predicted ATPase
MLRSDGSNAGSVLKNLERTDPPAVSQICDLLAQITPKTSGIKTVKHGKQLTLEFQQKWGENKKLKFEAYSASDGTLRALGILIALMQKPPATLLVIEEPESSLHPGALDALLQVIQSRAEHLQVLITTHSSDLLDAKWLKPENLRLVMWDGGSEIKPVSARAVKMLRSHLATAGELMRADALEEPLPLPLPLPQLQVHPEFNLFPDHK